MNTNYTNLILQQLMTEKSTHKINIGTITTAELINQETVLYKDMYIF